MSEGAIPAARRPTLDDVAEMSVRMLAELRDSEMECLVDEARRNPEHMAADFVVRLQERRTRTPDVFIGERRLPL